MTIIFTLLALGLGSLLIFSAHHSHKTRERAKFIDAYQFPQKIKTSVQEKYPHLSESQTDKVIEQLREYFHICNDSGKAFVSMPSEAVDTAWHEFILFTQKYAIFCNQAFGHFLHHTPAEGMPQPDLAQKGIKNAWRLACSRANINPTSPVKLPMLFAIDSLYNIKGGHIYQLDCRPGIESFATQTYCITHAMAINSGTTGCGGGSGCGSNTSSSDSISCGDSSGCGSGCGGGCGGG